MQKRMYMSRRRCAILLLLFGGLIGHKGFAERDVRISNYQISSVTPLMNAIEHLADISNLQVVWPRSGSDNNKLTIQTCGFYGWFVNIDIDAILHTVAFQAGIALDITDGLATVSTELQRDSSQLIDAIPPSVLAELRKADIPNWQRVVSFEMPDANMAIALQFICQTAQPSILIIDADIVENKERASLAYQSHTIKDVAMDIANALGARFQIFLDGRICIISRGIGVIQKAPIKPARNRE